MVNNTASKHGAAWMWVCCYLLQGTSEKMRRDKNQEVCFKGWQKAAHQATGLIKYQIKQCTYPEICFQECIDAASPLKNRVLGSNELLGVTKQLPQPSSGSVFILSQAFLSFSPLLLFLCLQFNLQSAPWTISAVNLSPET